jgi:tetratricopeptide (TPR) repeat protein
MGCSVGSITALDFPLLSKAPDVVLVVTLFAASLMAIRYFALRWRARTPRVQLSSVIQAMPEDGGSDGDGRDNPTSKQVDAPWVESLLREELSALRLGMAETLPEASSGAPLMEIVEGIGKGIGDKSTLGSALGKLYRAVVPEAAYEVSATVRPRDARHGSISVQVVDRTRRHPTRVCSSEDSLAWNEAARKAAAGVAGALYPQVADRHKGPWTLWREPVPAELVALNDEASKLENRSDLAQALDAYHEALDQDPLNSHLRIKIAMLHERLKRDLDAWATYRAIADERHRRCWKGADRRVRLLALYRLAILLANAQLASRWLEEAPADEERRRELTEALASDRHLARGSWWARYPDIAELLPTRFTTTPAARLLDDLRESSDSGSDADSPGEWVAGRLQALIREKARAKRRGERATEQRTVQDAAQIFEILSLFRLEQLDVRLRRKPPWRPWRWPAWWRYRPGLHHALNRREFSLSAVRVSKLFARIRIVESAMQLPPADDDSQSRATDARHRLRRRWPFSPTIWRRPARWLRPRHRLADRRDDAWQFHYNAACVVSTVLGDEATTPGTRDSALIEAGLKQLGEYVHLAGSTQVRSQADWVTSEDDDLRALRGTEEFRRWAKHYLPKAADGRGPLRPPRAPARPRSERRNRSRGRGRNRGRRR